MSNLLDCLINRKSSSVPVWFMRQAGRYLPEFRTIRSKNKDFLKLCFNSELAKEITLQPIKRFDLDAAIIFSDILVVPYALNQNIDFKGVDGPNINELNLNSLLNTSKKSFLSKLAPVYDAIKITRKNLKKEKSLISFVGAPWTLLIYIFGMKEGNKLNKNIFSKKKNEIKLVMKKLEIFLEFHIEEQIKSGADTVQIFDSWAGLIDEDDLEEFCFGPNQRLVNFVRRKKIPTICFPKGLKKNYKTFNEVVNCEGLNIDQHVDPSWARENLKDVCIQGGMDPQLLLKDSKLVLKEVEKYLSIFKNNPYIFNLGHGILPQTNPEIIKKIVDKIKK